MSKEISVIIRVMPNADDIEVTLPLESTPKDIVEALLDSDIGIPKIDPQGNPYVYELQPKGSNSAIQDGQSLQKANVQNGDTILMMADLIAG